MKKNNVHIADDGRFLTVSICKPYGEEEQEVLCLEWPYSDDEDREQLMENMLLFKDSVEFQCDLDLFEEKMEEMMSNLQDGEKMTLNIGTLIDVLESCII